MPALVFSAFRGLIDTSTWFSAFRCQMLLRWDRSSRGVSQEGAPPGLGGCQGLQDVCLVALGTPWLPVATWGGQVPLTQGWALLATDLVSGKARWQFSNILQTFWGWRGARLHFAKHILPSTFKLTCTFRETPCCLFQCSLNSHKRCFPTGLVYAIQEDRKTFLSYFLKKILFLRTQEVGFFQE